LNFKEIIIYKCLELCPPLQSYSQILNSYCGQNDLG